MANLLERAVRRAARSAVPARPSRSSVVARAAFVAAWILASAALGLSSAGSVAAHGELFFQLGAERVQPGGTVELRADLGAGEAFDITLVGRGDGARRFLTTLQATEEGHVQTYLTIPADVANGDYLVEIAYDVTVLRAPLTVAGAPIAGEQGELPGQDEGIGVVPAPGGGPAAATNALPPSPSRASDDIVDGRLVVLVAGVGAVGLVVALRLFGRARPKL